MEERPLAAINRMNEVGITIDGVNASWTSEIKTLRNLKINILGGTLCMVVGPTGAGKSSLIQLLLGELPVENGRICVGGSTAYASQEPWLFLSTIRKNIIFDQQYDPELYSVVVKCCALEKDFKLLPYGDKTLVGERGVSLSGGQRARINLARAIYRNSDVYLLDDPLSSVDSHVGKEVFENCVLRFLKGKTRILVTHQMQYLKVAHMIVMLKDGCVEAQGTFEELLNSSTNFKELIAQVDGDCNVQKHEESSAEKMWTFPTAVSSAICVFPITSTKYFTIVKYFLVAIINCSKT